MNDAINDCLVHSFSRSVAEKYGVNAAILLGYVGNRIKASKNVREGKTWFYSTIDELTDGYSYLKRTTVYEAIKILTNENGPLLRGNFNIWRNDKTTWYAFRDIRIAKELGSELLYFKVSDAKAYGVLEAVLLKNLAYWLAEKHKKDPGIESHPLSPRKLEEVFKKSFSRNSINRALKHLVEAGVLISKAPTDRTKPIEYSLAAHDDGSILETSGPIQNISKLAQNMVAGPIPNQADPDPNMPGPDQNKGGPIRSQPGPNPDDNTILINSLKDACLKEETLKEDHFKESAVVSVSNSPGADASLTSQSSTGQTSDRNEFYETIASTTPGMPPFKMQIKEITSKPKAFHELSEGNPHKHEHFYTFLDLDGVHKCCWEVLEFHNTNANPTYQEMAEAIAVVAERLINQTEPSEIHRLAIIPSQAELNRQLYPWFFKFFSDFYDLHFAMEPENNEHLKEMFLSHSICFFNMAFHNLKFEIFRIYIGFFPVFRIMQVLHNRVSPWIDEQKAKKRDREMKEREIKFASPDKDKEGDPNLSAPEKMNVLLQGLQARNRIGKYNELGRFSEKVVETTQNTGNLARKFFQLNPHLTIQDINRVIDACVKLPTWNSEEPDPIWHARNGYKISLLLNNLTQVATQLEMLSQIPQFTPLPIEEKSEGQFKEQ